MEKNEGTGESLTPKPTGLDTPLEPLQSAVELHEKLGNPIEGVVVR
jgi:hypothetical protein